jgi:DNA-binding NarL/FixJ family response regulator
VSTRFSPRQAEIVSLVAGGLGDKEIALRLGVSVSTVRTHLQRLYREIGVHSRSKAVATWFMSEAQPGAQQAGAWLSS